LFIIAIADHLQHTVMWSS